MPILYLAKVNLNSNIFDVYEKKLTIEDVVKKIYESIDSNLDYKKRTKEKYSNSYGGVEEYYRDSKYCFQEIDKKPDSIITGKVVRTFNKPSEKLNIVTEKMETTYVEESVSIYFYYDVANEMITFCERQSFGYNQFTEAFTALLNKSVEKYQFEIFLQKDKDLLDEKLKELKIVTRVKAVLIPPNSNEDDLEMLRQQLGYMQQVQDVNATRMQVEYDSPNMKMDSQLMREIFEASSRGYGDVTATGTLENGSSRTVRSNQDAAFTSNIADNIQPEEYNEESKNLIRRFLEKRLLKKH